jgi:hypothetical protein
LCSNDLVEDTTTMPMMSFWKRQVMEIV